MKFLPFYFVLIAALGMAQKPFLIDGSGRVSDDALDKIVAERGYEVVSAFDTVWTKPVLVYAQYVKNGKFGIIDIYGNQVTPPVYDKIDGLNRSHSAYLFGYHKNYVVQMDGRYGLIENTGKTLIPAQYRYLFPISGDSLHFKATGLDELEFAVDIRGNKVTLTPRKDPYEDQQRTPQPQWRLSDNGKYYFVRNQRTKKETKIPNLGAFVQNFGTRIAFKNTDGKMGLYSIPDKKLVVPFEYEAIRGAYKGYFEVTKGNRVGAIDSVGTVVLPIAFDNISCTSGGARAYHNKTYTLYDSRFKRLSPMTFDQTGYMGPKGITLKKDGKWALMATDGTFLTGFDYERMEIPEDHDLPFTIIVAAKNGKLGVMDFKGKIYTDFIYDQILPESNVFPDSRSLEPVFNGYSNQPNLFHYVRMGGKWGLLDNDFRPMIAPAYDYFLESYDRKVLQAKRGGKWGLIEVATERVIIPFEFDGPLEWKQGNYQVYKDRTYGLVDKTGKVLIPLGQRSPINSELVFGGLWKIMDYAARSYFYLDYRGRTSAKVTLR